MVQATVNNGIVNLESIIQITENQRNAIKANPKKVKAACKDVGVEHFLSSTEDGTPISKLGRAMNGTFDPQREISILQEQHKHLLDWISDFNAELECTNSNHTEQVEDKPTEKTDGENKDNIFKSVVDTIKKEYDGFCLIVTKNDNARVAGNIPKPLAALMLID